MRHPRASPAMRCSRRAPACAPAALVHDAARGHRDAIVSALLLHAATGGTLEKPDDSDDDQGAKQAAMRRNGGGSRPL